MDTEFFRIGGYILLCLIVPIAWGWLVSLIFHRLFRRRKKDTSSVIDYQI